MYEVEVTEGVRVLRRGDEIVFQWTSGDTIGEGPYLTIDEAVKLARDIEELSAMRSA